jgi:alanine racemase
MDLSIIEISTWQLITNLKSIRSWVNATPNQSIKLCFPVKANAYGHGLVGTAKTVEPYVDYLAVANDHEARILRENEIRVPILIFSAFSYDNLDWIIRNNIEITILSLQIAKQIQEICISIKARCRVHIKIDTGMNRLGVNFKDACGLINFVYNAPELELIGVYSHLASSDQENSTTTLAQIDTFSKLVAQIKQLNSNIICHLANSGGICHYPQSYFDMVRPGILSYGYFPRIKLAHYPLNKIQPCFTLKSQILFFKDVEKGQGISYNHTYITASRTHIATLPIGYGDGYRRMLSNYGEVLIGGHKYIISGTICMDMLMVDVGIDNTYSVGDEVILIGAQGSAEITLESVAKKCNTIVYEILCGFTSRIPRIYI